MDEAILKRVTGRQWYHQRFDGSPMYLSMVGEAEVRVESRKPAGTEAKWRICFFEKGKADWFLDMADVDRGAQIITAMTKDSATVSQELMAKWQSDEVAFEAYFQDFDQAKLADFADDELYAEFERYHQFATNRFTSSSIIDHFALGTDEKIAEMLRQEAGPFTNESAFSKVFSVATAPVHQSFINEAEIALLRIAAKVQQGQSIESPAIISLLTDHQQQFFWTVNNYVKAQILSIDYFKEEVEAWLQTGKDLATELTKIERTPIRSRQAKEELFAQHELSQDLLRLLKVSEDFTRWQDERKKASYYSIHLGSLILSEMAKRRSINPGLTKYLLPTEVDAWFNGGHITADQLADREQKSAIILEPDQGTVYTGSIVDQIHQSMFATTEDRDIQDLRGLVACTGRAIGTVKRVMSAEEVGKVQEGDILVAVMTTPEFVPAMRQALAVVTDEGGVTSHAAIVSRELAIPCLIGTGSATRVFKTDDEVELNMRTGQIRLLKRGDQ